MKIHDCPRCQQHSLITTGAFWSCESCRYAITQTALSAEEAGDQAGDRYRSAGSHVVKDTTS